MISFPPAVLALADGSIFRGIAIGAHGHGVGELVFNTSMTGYQEILTDPSYTKQIITFTAAHIGNTGCNMEDMESTKVWASGLVVRNYDHYYSNYRGRQSLSDWLKKHAIVAISNVDTRALTLKLRAEGTIGACISTNVDDVEKAVQLAKDFKGLESVDLASLVSRQAKERWHEGQGLWGKNSLPQTHHVVVYDFGVKHSILRILYDLGCHLTLVPAKTPVEDVINMKPDGVLLSNGPGDPFACEYAIEATKRLLEEDIPLFGICLGFQILALACGATSLKMKFGHHGGNHPVLDVHTHRVFITSQNHGFAIDEASLPETLEVTHRSLFDQSLQGIAHCHRRAFGFQGHPEAGPGPHDLYAVFEKFIELMFPKSSELF